MYRSTTHAIRTCLAQEGVSGLYRGVIPVTLKQSANVMVRFTSYRFFLGQMDAIFSRDNAGALQSMNMVIAGALAGVVTVYATIPFDTIKSKTHLLQFNL